MRSLFEALVRNARAAGDRRAVSDPHAALTRAELVARIARLAGDLAAKPGVIGILAPNGVDWVVAQLAGALAGKIVVPLPTFFSAAQLAHIARDASVELILATEETWPRALQSGIAPMLIGSRPAEGLPDLADGFGQVIYTSGSTGAPKGVRHGSGQIAWISKALSDAAEVSERDSYLSVLPLPLLLETICAVFIPVLAGGPVHFETAVAEGVGQGSASGIAAAVETHLPSMCVLVPQLLKAWVGELASARKPAPASLRFVAVGGAPLPAPIAKAAWSLGIPAYEGYGLSECCSVVSLNRAGANRPGTAGRPLAGLAVSIEAGEIVVDGPSVMDGYLGEGPADRPWRTGDLGAIDADGLLTVHGRKDNLIVTAFGRNVSPEWVETMLQADGRIALAAVVGHGEPHLTALIIPTPASAPWFASAAGDEIQALISTCCAAAPDYAVPRAFRIVPLQDAIARQLIASNGRIRRGEVRQFLAAHDRAEADSLVSPL